jgi:hypothetical protein
LKIALIPARASLGRERSSRRRHFGGCGEL